MPIMVCCLGNKNKDKSRKAMLFSFIKKIRGGFLDLIYFL